VHGRSVAQDVDGVIQAPQQPGAVEVVGLLAVVLMISRWSRVSPASTTPSSSPGWPFSVQIAPVIEAATRNRSICSQRRAPPCPSMASFNSSFMLPASALGGPDAPVSSLARTLVGYRDRP